MVLCLDLNLKDENGGLCRCLTEGEVIPGLSSGVRESLLPMLFSFECWYAKDASDWLRQSEETFTWL